MGNANRDSSSQMPAESEDPLLAEFKALWSEADEIWLAHQNDASFHGYVSADYLAVYRSLQEMQNRVASVLEWGSGLGVVAIMASRMGFESYGIEAESALVELSDSLAASFGPDATFATGSFIPDDFQWDPGESEVNRTMIDVASGYDELDMELRDFDLIYAYPWPDEHELYHSIMRQFARPEAMLLMYDAREGMDLVRFAE